MLDAFFPGCEISHAVFIRLLSIYANRIVTARYCHIFPFLFIVLSVLFIVLFFPPLCFWYMVLLNFASHACHFLLRGSLRCVITQIAHAGQSRDLFGSCTTKIDSLSVFS